MVERGSMCWERTHSESSRNFRTLYIVINAVGLDEIMIMGDMLPIGHHDEKMVLLTNAERGVLTVLPLGGVGV